MAKDTTQPQHIDLDEARVTAWRDDQGQLQVRITGGDLTAGQLKLHPQFGTATVQISVDGAAPLVDPTVFWADLHHDTDAHNI